MNLRDALHMVRGLRADAFYCSMGKNAYGYDLKTKKFLKYPMKGKQSNPTLFLTKQNNTGSVNLSYFKKFNINATEWYTVLPKNKWDETNTQFYIYSEDSNFFTIR